MNSLLLHKLHQDLGARFAELNGAEIVSDYGDFLAEHAALKKSADVFDLSFRGRICLTGADRVRFLHGQVTNDVKRLRTGEGCYAALVTAKGKMQSDLNIHCLENELLLDFEPELTAAVSQRLEKYIVADDVQIVDVAADYGLLSVQGPQAADVVRRLEMFPEIPASPFHSARVENGSGGESYLINQPRLGSAGFDLFVPANSLRIIFEKLVAAAKAIGGRACGWQAFEIARIEAGIPRYGIDMDETNLPLECGIEERAVSYRKGCYIGQEVINRIHTIGHVNRELRGLLLAESLAELPVKGARLFHAGKEVGYITSAAKSPALKRTIALGYVHRDIKDALALRSESGETEVEIVPLPFSA